MLLSRRILLAALAPAAPERIVATLPDVQIIDSNWREDIDALSQPGSLWKPFLAAAHRGPNLRFHCDGTQCWLNRKHGWLDMPGALAQSCNQWFHQLYKTLPKPLNLLGLPRQDSDDWTQWRCSPRQLLQAYAELIARRNDHPLVIAGLRQAAEQGTAKSLGKNHLAKTGTGPSKLFSGDGWVFAAHPADMPTKIVLYRQRGATGAQAAAALARLRII
jgi:hypothetical protein